MTIRGMLITTILACTALAGCVQETPQRPFGTAYRQQLAAQKLNPEPAPATPVTGLDGRRALDVVGNYREPETDSGPSFAKVLESLMQTSK